GVTYTRQAFEETQSILFGATFPVPLWNRNRGGRAAARAALSRANIVESSARREAEREARTAAQTYQLAIESVQSFDRDVVDRLGENLALARESSAAGKIGLLELNIVRRDLVETRLAYLAALAQAVAARAALAAATGADVE